MPRDYGLWGEKLWEEAEELRVRAAMESILAGLEEATDTSDTFLTPGELKSLTGRSQRRAQSRFLSTRGIKFEVNQVGRVIVLQDELRRHLTTPKKATKKAPSSDEPDWDKMK